MTTPKDKKVSKKEIKQNENLFFNNDEDLILTEQEVKDLENKLINLKIDNKTHSFFNSAHNFYKKLEENDYIISLEEIEKD